MNDRSSDTTGPQSVAVLGTGRMGAAAARRLLARGHPVTAWNRSPARAEPLTEHGARIVSSPAEAVKAAGVVVVFLADATAVDETLLGASGALAALPPQAVVAQMSTIGPEAVMGLATRLPQGTRLLDAPVKGSVPAVENGELEIYVGGDQAALDAASATLTDLGTPLHCGNIGAASALKLVINAAMILAVTALAEVTSLAQALDIPADQARKVLAASPLAGALKRAQAQGADFPIAHARKDLALAAEVIPDAHFSMLGEQLLREAAHQDVDLGRIVRY